MKITIANGNLELPADYSITIERNNPLFNTDGDASLPMSLPASPANLKLLNYPNRIDNAKTSLNRIPATLHCNVIQKNGTLIIGSSSIKSIEAEFALDNSELYANNKEKSLKELFENTTESFDSIDSALQAMQNVYDGILTKNYIIAPMAVAPYEEDNQTIYQYNNEIDSAGNLVFNARTVHENGMMMAVPKGYGISPQLKLNKLIKIMFDNMGFKIMYNVFDNYPQFILANNCSDSVTSETLHYSDMVPDCSVSEFLEWLNNKFHCQPIIDSNTNKCWLIATEQAITQQPSYDISKIIDDDFVVNFNSTSRTILEKPSLLEGAESAEETLDNLVSKYGTFTEVNEQEFASLSTNNPAYFDCVVIRKATGMFYALTRNLSTGKQYVKMIGTNYHTYNRSNSTDEESFSQQDTAPLMLCTNKAVCGYIGERINYHTNYNNQEENNSQSIILMQFAQSSLLKYKCTATTQKFIPTTRNSEYRLPFALDNYSLYNEFWKNYNYLLLNGKITISAKARYSLSQFLNMKPTEMLLFKNQKAMLLSASASIDRKIKTTSAEYLLIKKFTDGITDEQITPQSPSAIKWERKTNITDVYNDIYNEEFDERQSWWEQMQQQPGTLQWYLSSVQYMDRIDNTFLGHPKEIGQLTDTYYRLTKLNITERFTPDDEHFPTVQGNYQPERTSEVWFEAVNA